MEQISEYSAHLVEQRQPHQLLPAPRAGKRSRAPPPPCCSSSLSPLASIDRLVVALEQQCCPFTTFTTRPITTLLRDSTLAPHAILAVSELLARSHNAPEAPSPSARSPLLPARRSVSASPARRPRPTSSYGSMQERTQPDAGPSTAPLVYPARAAVTLSSSAPGPFATDRPPSPTTSLRSRNGKHRADTSADSDTVLDPASASTGAAPPPPAPAPPPAAASAPRNRKKWRGLVFELENRGSVARDHLASERTFLAWLRTSLGLASIGIAITQLFRLPSTTTTSSTPSPTSTTPSSSASAASSSLSSALAALASSNPSLAPLVPILEAQQAQLDASARTQRDSTRYRHLGKPIGGTFILLALVFLFLGIHRYFAIQAALMREPSQFPPSRRSVGFGAAGVAALILASFVAILATK